MNRLIITVLAAAAIAATAARADHVDIRGSINFGAPGYVAPAPGYYAPNNGYWRDVPMNVWVPPHWEVRTNRFGQLFNYYEPGHYVTRVQRVWVNRDSNRGWRDREWREHERREREHDDRRDNDDWRR